MPAGSWPLGFWPTFTRGKELSELPDDIKKEINGYVDTYFQEFLKNNSSTELGNSTTLKAIEKMRVEIVRKISDRHRYFFDRALTAIDCYVYGCLTGSLTAYMIGQKRRPA